jgi:hypothetical protein
MGRGTWSWIVPDGLWEIAEQADTRTTTAAATAPTPIRTSLGSGRSREEHAAIRTWVRANGHQVAHAGMVCKTVLEAYDAAHQTPVRKAADPWPLPTR